MKTKNTLYAILAWAALFSACAGDGQRETRAAAPAETAPAKAAPSGLYWQRLEENGRAWLSDKAGNKVPFGLYKRIIVLSPGAVETLYLIGAEASILAISENREPVWPAEKTASFPTAGSTARPSLERIIALDGDLVLGNAMNAAVIADLAARGKPAIIHGADSIEDIFNAALVLGDLTGTRPRAEALVLEKRALLESLDRGGKSGRKRPLKGAFLYSVNPVSAFTETSLPGEIFSLLGAENIAAGLPSEQPVLSPEYILTRNPDFLFGAMSITRASDILNADPVIMKTTAGIRGSVTIVPSAYFLRPSPRIVDCVLELARSLRPLEEEYDESAD